MTEDREFAVIDTFWLPLTWCGHRKSTLSCAWWGALAGNAKSFLRASTNMQSLVDFCFCLTTWAMAIGNSRKCSASMIGSPNPSIMEGQTTVFARLKRNRNSVSYIPVLREVCEDFRGYFDLEKANFFANIIRKTSGNRDARQ